MNSFAHYSFGAVYQWMVENIGGIRSDGPAYQHIIIAPQLDGKLTEATTSYDSIRGRIETGWKRDGGNFSLHVIIPPNTAATVYLPLNPAAANRISESGRPLESVKGVKLLRMENDRAVLEVESGSYHFVVKS